MPLASQPFMRADRDILGTECVHAATRWVAENLSGAARLPIGDGGLVVPPVLVAVFAFVRGRGPILSLSEPKAIDGASIRTRRAFHSWAIWGVVGVAAGVTGLVLSWAER